MKSLGGGLLLLVLGATSADEGGPADYQIADATAEFNSPSAGNSRLRYFSYDTYNRAGAGGLAKDSMGAIYLVGAAGSSTGSSPADFGTLAKFDISGRLLWESSDHNVVGEPLREVTIDSADRVYLSSEGTGRIRRITTDGALVWAITLPLPDDVPNVIQAIPYRIVTDDDGVLVSMWYVTSDPSFPRFTTIAKVRADGSILWQRSIFPVPRETSTGELSRNDIVIDNLFRVFGLTPDQSGGVFAVAMSTAGEHSRTTYFQLDSNGELLTPPTLLVTPLDLNDVVGDESLGLTWLIRSHQDDLFLAGRSRLGSTLLKMDMAGNVLWIKTKCEEIVDCSFGDRYYKPVFSSDGALILIEHSYHYDDGQDSRERISLVRISSDGVFIDSEIVGQISGTDSLIQGLGLSISGNRIWVSGFRSRVDKRSGVGVGHDMFLLRCDGDGNTRKLRCPTKAE